MRLLQVVVVEVAVNAENDIVAHVEVIASIDATDEAVRLELVGLIRGLVVKLGAAPAPANLTTDISAAP